MLEFLNKGSRFSSLAGEKVSEFQVSRAVEQSLAELDLTLTAFTLAPRWGDPPYYSLLVEASDLPGPELATALAQAVDRHLAAQNLEYDSKRVTRRLGPVSVRLLGAGAWAEFTRKKLDERGGTLEQYKHPCLVSEPDFASQLPLLQEVLPIARAQKKPA
jgi:hypothetical protein